MERNMANSPFSKPTLQMPSLKMGYGKALLHRTCLTGLSPTNPAGSFLNHPLSLASTGQLKDISEKAALLFEGTCSNIIIANFFSRKLAATTLLMAI
jgi:hypothetical protein